MEGVGDTVVAAAGSAAAFDRVIAGDPEEESLLPKAGFFARFGVATAQPLLAMQSLNTVTNSALRAALFAVVLVAATVVSAMLLHALLIS